MTQPDQTLPEHSLPEETPQEADAEARRFHGWRLLGIIGTAVLILAAISAVIDWLVIGPLGGR